MSSKEEVIKKIIPTSTYIGTAVRAFVSEVKVGAIPSVFKKGDIIIVQDTNTSKKRPSVIIKVKKDYVISIPLTSSENIHAISESKSRFLNSGFFCSSYNVTPIEKAKENFIGVYDNPKLLNEAIKQLRLFIVKNI